MKKSLDLYLVSFDVALLVTAISNFWNPYVKSFQNLWLVLLAFIFSTFWWKSPLFEGFFELTPTQKLILKNRTLGLQSSGYGIWMKIHCSSLPICIGRGPKNSKSRLMWTRLNCLRLILYTGRCRKKSTLLKKLH